MMHGQKNIKLLILKSPGWRRHEYNTRILYFHTEEGKL